MKKDYKYYILNCPKKQILFFISDTIDAIFRKSYSSVIYHLLDGSFIFVQNWFSTLEFEKYYLPKGSFWESIEDDIITSFSDKNHIFWGVWKIRKCWKYFFIYFTEDTTSRSLDSLVPYSLFFVEWEDLHDKNPNQKTKQSSKYESYYIHILFFAFL